MRSVCSCPALDLNLYFRRAIDSFAACWELPILNGTRRKFFLLGVVIGLCALRAYIGLIGARLFAPDAFMLFDGAWRMMNGQRPHIDFYSHLGFLTYVPTVAGLSPKSHSRCFERFL